MPGSADGSRPWWNGARDEVTFQAAVGAAKTIKASVAELCTITGVVRGARSKVKWTLEVLDLQARAKCRKSFATRDWRAAIAIWSDLALWRAERAQESVVGTYIIP